MSVLDQTVGLAGGAHVDSHFETESGLEVKHLKRRRFLLHANHTDAFNRDLLDFAGETAPSFSGEVRPSFHVDEEMFSASNTGGASSFKTILARHQVCEAHFDVCWNQAHKVWLPGVHCKTGAQVCPAVLCTSWMEANCMTFEKKCPEINEMCHWQAGHATQAIKEGHEPDPETGLYEAAREEPMVFLHIPKTAGTAIENAGLSQNVRWGRHRMYYFGMMPMSDGLYCTTHHVPPRHLPQVMAGIYRESEVFCVARHPYERAVSEYKYLLAVPWGRDKPGLLEKEECTAEGLNHFLTTSLRMVMSGQRFVNDCHMLPQSEYIFDQKKQWCKDVLRFEYMPKAFDKLMEKKGYNVRLDHSENESGTCKNLTRAALNASTLKLLNEMYDEDFRRLGYSKEHGTT